MSELNGLAEAVARRLIERGESVAVGESAAGGLIAAALLGVAGASAYFKGGVVVYTSEGKVRLAGMTMEQIAKDRAATAPHTAILARLIREKLDATWGVAETGAAGPTGNRYGDPAGHTCVAAAGPIERAITLATGSDDRLANMRAFAVAALRLMAESLGGNKQAGA
jgi:nicotinamide-nucleotide amidase